MSLRLILSLVAAIGCLDTQAKQPNIVYIISDDQAYTDFGFMGHPHIRTPHIDRLAEHSAVFPNGYVTSSVCRPSIVTLLTGRYPFQHGVHFNHPPPGFRALTQDPDLTKAEYDALREKACDLIRNQTTLPRMLAANGYRCLQTGKFWEGHWRNAGFTEGMTLAEPSNALNGNKTIANGEVVAHGNGDAGLAIGRETMQPIYDFLDDCGSEQPFMIWYAPFLPHTPHDSPERFYKAYQNKGIAKHTIPYYACISWFDETVGQLAQAIEDRGLRQNTLFLFAVDNGFEPDPKNPRNYTQHSKRSPFEPGLRTPMLLRWDGVIEPGTHQELVSSIDLFPTILDAASIEVPDNTPGISLFSTATGTGTLESSRAVFGAIYPGDASELGNPAGDVAYRWIRQGDFKLVVPSSDNAWGSYLSKPALFNLKEDPFEETNLATTATYQRVLKSLTNELNQWWNPDLGP